LAKAEFETYSTMEYKNLQMHISNIHATYRNAAPSCGTRHLLGVNERRQMVHKDINLLSENKMVIAMNAEPL
jgi:hypothetical protein